MDTVTWDGKQGILPAHLEPVAAIAASQIPVVATTAVTRSYSDMDPVTMVMTYGAASLCYSVAAHPLFLSIARQQSCRTRISVLSILKDLYSTSGVRGWFRGVGIATVGTVLSEVVYFLIVEYMREHLPLDTLELRSFGAGIAADLVSTPLYVPFSVVSQVQMVAGCGINKDERYVGGLSTMRNLVRDGGVRTLFRGTLLSISMAPLAGAWWFLYDYLKGVAYEMAPEVGGYLGPHVPHPLSAKLPSWCTSTTDNMLINCSVGATASCLVSIALNPLYVLRLRVQVSKRCPKSRMGALAIIRDVLHHEGVGAFFKGVKTNIVLAVFGGCAFGVTYEGTKQFSDVSGKPTT